MMMASILKFAAGIIPVGLTAAYYCWKSFTKNYPYFCELSGPFKNIGVSYHRIPNNIRFKIYYPTTESNVKSSNAQPPQYFHDGSVAAKGLHHFISNGAKIPFLFSIINSLSTSDPKQKKYSVPCYENAPINKSNKTKKFPLILMSHGMSGNWDVYAQICCNLASYGLMVAMIEHDDGSASHCKLSSGKDLIYIFQHIINEKGEFERGHTRKHTMQFRGPQLDRRVVNMMDMYEYIYSEQCKEDKMLYDDLRPLIDFNNLFVCGHSYGGITAVWTAKAMLKEKEKYSNLKGCFVFEPWFEPKSDDLLKEEWNLPYLCLIGDRWMKSKTLWNLLCFVQSANKNEKMNCLKYLNGFSHQDFCDAAMFAPQWLLSRANSCSKTETCEDAQAIIIKECMQFICSLVPELKEAIDQDKYLKYNDRNVSIKAPKVRE